MFLKKGPAMKKRIEKATEQPKPFTPGVSKAAVRQHAYEMFRDKLPDHPLTLEDWVLAEKDLVAMMHAEQSA
jgi:lipoate-protein ligase A